MAQEVASIFARVGADLSDFHRGMGQFNSAIHGAGGMFRSFTTGIVQGIGQAFGYASLRAIREFGDVVAGVIGSAAGMEQSVADIAATMGLTAEETARVSALVSNLGIDPKLKVTATEAAAAVEMLGKNGLALDEIIKGAARSTVLLSNSTGGDFSTSADIATSAMAQFKIKAEDMTGAVDQMVGVTRNSKFDINDYGLAISQAGGITAAANIKFEDFNAIMAATASNFSGGSDWGTSFKTFVQRLVPQSAEAAEAMRKIGLYTGLTGKEFDAVQDKIVKTQQKIEDLDPTSQNYSKRLSELSAELVVLQKELMAGDSAFFDINGNIKSGAEISGALKKAFAGLSDEQRINAATTIFGTDAMRMAFGMADSGIDVINEFKTAIGDTSAEESAAIRMNTLKGAWEIFTGIVESLSIKFGTAFLPALRDVVAALTDLAGRVGPQLEVWGAQLGERLKLVAAAAIELLNVGLDKGLLAIFAPLPDGTREIDKLWQSFGLTTEESGKLSERLIGTARVIMDTTSAVVSLIGTIANIVSPMVTWIDKNIGLENALRGVALVMAGGFVASIVSTIATIVSAVGSVAGFVASLTGLGSVATTIGGAVAAAISLMGGPITLLIAAIGALALAWQNNWWDIQGKTRAAWDAIKGFFADGIASIKNFFNGGWFEIGQNMVRGIVDGIRAGWTWVTDAAKGVAEAALSTAKGALGIQSPSRVFQEVGHNITAGLAKGIDETIQLPQLSINRMVSHDITVAPPATPLSSGTSRLDIYLHGESNLPADRAKLRELARALQQEFVFTGARVAVT